MLFNSAFSLSMASSLAELISTTVGTEPEALVQAAVWRCYSRAPTAPEIALGATFLQQHTAQTSTFHEALTDYCLALLNSSAFCYVD
jgi:hypothetical protein